MEDEPGGPCGKSRTPGEGVGMPGGLVFGGAHSTELLINFYREIASWPPGVPEVEGDPWRFDGRPHERRGVTHGVAVGQGWRFAECLHERRVVTHGVVVGLGWCCEG